MLRTTVVAVALSAAVALPLRAQARAAVGVQPPEKQIAAAVLPLPEQFRAGAAVLGFDAQGRLTRLRAGAGVFTCLADDPREDRFHVACYHNSLEPFMARGRELRAQGVTAVDSVRYAEVRSGRLRMPAVAALYSLTGDARAYDPASGAVRGARPLFVVYVPGATEASTGISARPSATSPWLMEPGTPKAHIMFQGGM